MFTLGGLALSSLALSLSLLPSGGIDKIFLVCYTFSHENLTGGVRHGGKGFIKGEGFGQANPSPQFFVCLAV
jgi:hypothetical protein